MPVARQRRRITGWDVAVLVAANAVAVVGLWWRQGGIREIHDLVRAAQQAGCEYCLDIGPWVARNSGVPERQIRELHLYQASDAFDHLDAPIVRITSLDTPVPFSPPLEKFFLPKVEDVVREARRLKAY